MVQKGDAGDVDDFFAFLQGQLRMEALNEGCGDLMLPPTGASIWPEVSAWTQPNISSGKWTPYHVCLSPQERFLLQQVHAEDKWDAWQRWVAMFIFRGHGRQDVFTEVQKPLMAQDGFWRSPTEAFAPEGGMEAALVAYRKNKRKPLLCGAYRQIPPRTLEDDDWNLVRSIAQRTQKLLALAEEICPILRDEELSPAQKELATRDKVMAVPGFDRTWAKLVVVGIDLAYPELRLLERQCPVGVGAAPSLRWLMGDGGQSEEQLPKLLQVMNSSCSASALDFWQTLRDQEALLTAKWQHAPLLARALLTNDRQTSAAILQVQLCEYRQFRQKHPVGGTPAATEIEAKVALAVVNRRIRCETEPGLGSASAKSGHGEASVGSRHGVQRGLCACCLARNCPFRKMGLETTSAAPMDNLAKHHAAVEETSKRKRLWRKTPPAEEQQPTKRRRVTKTIQARVAPVGDLAGDLRIRAQAQVDEDPVELSATAYPAFIIISGIPRIPCNQNSCA